jgi:hypothetical protein
VRAALVATIFGQSVEILPRRFQRGHWCGALSNPTAVTQDQSQTAADGLQPRLDCK